MPPAEILRDAMLALHDVLADIESDIAEEEVVRDTTTHPARHLIAADLIGLWQRQHDKLAQFFDWDVYHGEPAAATAAA